ncbi:MAG: formylglycine-generating enzyme family protein [Oligoflexia bacterium]|nr:formylglycine-generating enzyme family protein [Oligoflexia bacterium]
MQSGLLKNAAQKHVNRNFENFSGLRETEGGRRMHHSKADFEFSTEQGNTTIKAGGETLLIDSHKLCMQRFRGRRMKVSVLAVVLSLSLLTTIQALAGGINNALFVKIPHGTFQMGSPAGEDGHFENEGLHTVTISHDFEIGVYDVTQRQWFQVMGNNPSYFSSQRYCGSDFVSVNGIGLCPNNPVEQVSWNDAQSFIQKLNQAGDGYTYRLPTEAEWEYAARAGSQTAYYFGNDENLLDANAWYAENAGSQTHPVGLKTANAFGLYDLAGNVFQWVQDYYGGNYASASVTDPVGPSSGTIRVFRGGGWAYYPQFCRSAVRFGDTPETRTYDAGFRLVRTKSVDP